MAQTVTSRWGVRRRVRAPRFALALPAWVWFAFFFAIPVLTIVYYSFGYKPGIFDQIATDQLSLGRYSEILQPTFFKVFSQTLQISLIGTTMCFLIGFPFAYWLPVRVPPRGARLAALAGPAARPVHRAVLAELPDPHDRLADTPVAERTGERLPAVHRP